MTTIERNICSVRDRMLTACVSVGRNPTSVSLLAVSKTFGVDAVLEAMATGQCAFGENYIAEGVEKIVALQEHKQLVWHCIGPVQSNKRAWWPSILTGYSQLTALKLPSA